MTHRFDARSKPMTTRLSRRAALRTTGAGLVTGLASTTGLHTALAQTATPPTAADSLGTVTPARAALAVDRLPALAEEILAMTGVPGMAVTIVFDDTVVFRGGFGVREVGTDGRVDANTVFQLASLSKPVASTVVSAVVGDSTLTWNSRVADIDPGFALHDAWPTQEVTLADLFAHRSGLPDHAGDLLEDLGFDRDEILHRLRYLTPAYSFRNGYQYTNFGLTAAAVAAAQAAGMSWDELSEERLYQPLGMTQTSSSFADYMAAANRAVPHVRDGDTWVVTPTQRDPDAQSPAGGVSSTASDIAQWVRLQLGQGMVDGEQLIPAEVLAPTHIPQAVSRTPQDPATQQAGFYGLGWNVGYDDFGAVRWSHSGAFSLGAGTSIFLLPEAGFGVVAVTNGSPVGAAEALCLSVVDLAQRGEITQDWLATVTPVFVALMEPEYGTGTDWDAAPATATAALPDDAYLGTYGNSYYGDVDVIRAADGLALRIGPNAVEFPLTHYDRDTFSWQPPGENATVRSGLVFIIGPDDTATGFVDEYLDSGGPGTLIRPDAPGQ